MKMDTASSLIRLSDIAVVRSGFPFRGSLDAIAAGDVAVVQMRDVAEGVEIQWEELLHIDLPTNRKPAYIESGDILFTTRGTRNTAIFLNNAPTKAVSAANLFVIRVKDPNEAMPEFLAWQINQRAAQDYLATNATGTHIKNVTRPTLEALPIAKPSVATQSSIIDIARSAFAEQQLYENLIQNRQQQIDAIASNLLSEKVAQP